MDQIRTTVFQDVLLHSLPTKCKFGDLVGDLACTCGLEFCNFASDSLARTRTRQVCATALSPYLLRFQLLFGTYNMTYGKIKIKFVVPNKSRKPIRSPTFLDAVLGSPWADSCW